MCYIQYLLCTHMHRICMYIHVCMDILYVIFSIKSSKLIYTIGRSSTNLNKVQIHSKNLREQGKLLMLSTQNVLTKLVFQRRPYLRMDTIALFPMILDTRAIHSHSLNKCL